MNTLPTAATAEHAPALTNPELLWPEVKARFFHHVGKDAAEAMLGSLAFYDYDAETGTLYMAMSSVTPRNWLKRNHLGALLTCWQAVFPAIQRIEFDNLTVHKLKGVLSSEIDDVNCTTVKTYIPEPPSKDGQMMAIVEAVAAELDGVTALVLKDSRRSKVLTEAFLVSAYLMNTCVPATVAEIQDFFPNRLPNSIPNGLVQIRKLMKGSKQLRRKVEHLKTQLGYTQD